jgi:glycosyltransferase involved in cell wall biosynthesis
VTTRTLPAPAAEQAARAPLKVLLVLKTSEGALWVLPHVDELRRRGHAVVVVLPKRPGRLRTALSARAVPVVDSPFDFRFRPFPRTLTGLLRLRRLINRLSPDVLHYHLYASALAARLSSLGLGIPRVHMVAGPLHLEWMPTRTAERLLARLDTVTIGGSDFISERYRELGRPAARTPSIPYGVDTGHFQPPSGWQRDRARAALGLGPGTFLVVMVAFVYAPRGRLHAGHGIKGHDVLLAAWTSFHTEHPDARLFLVGGGFDDAGERHRKDLIRLFRLDDPRTAHGVTWLESTDDVRLFYAAADLSVSPSLSDNHGAAVEAGAMGLPSIVSDAGALPETVSPESGWVVPRGDSDSLVAALRHAHAEGPHGLLPTRGRAARQLVLRRFSGTRAAKAVATAIEQAAGRPPHPARVLSLFTDARFVAAAGQWTAVDPANGPAAREMYLRSGSRVRVVARAEPLPGRNRSALDAGSDLVPMPYYVGAGGLLRALPVLSGSVARAVAGADVVLLRVPGAVGSLAALACRMLRRRYAVEVVGDAEEVLRSGTLGRTGRLLARPAGSVQRWVVHGADASRFVTRDALQRRYPPRPGTPAMAISNVRLGPDALLRQSREWPQSPFHIVAIGSHETRYKGHDVLLKAVRRLLDAGLPVTATVAGNGRRHDELVDLCRSTSLTDTVSFVGPISRAEVVELLDSAALFVMPSRTEGLPRALVEAMARALPAVGSAVGGIPELLDESCLVPPDDPEALAAAIHRLLSDPKTWEEQSRRNLETARGFEQSVADRLFATWLSQVPPARGR